MKQSQHVLKQLRTYESRNVTFMEPDGSWPIVWDRARGTSVWDAEGKKYLDLTAAFGVAAAGHANPQVVVAARKQAGHLLHAMGDVHPHALKGQLARALADITFERWTHNGAKGAAKTIFCNSGFEAVEAALKTAMIATHKPGVIAFKGAYHGLGYGALNVTHRAHFRGPFLPQLGGFARFVEFPKVDTDLKKLETSIVRLLERDNIGAILAEPIQVRGGVNVPPTEFLAMLRHLATEFGVLLVLDEVYTGFGRTGAWFACDHCRVIPDLICLGKALTGGFPLSACVGRARIMDAWPASSGEAIHTSTFLGHPVGCAMALAQISELKKHRLPARSAAMGNKLMELLRAEIRNPNLKIEIRGRGLLAGVELRLKNSRPATELCIRTIKEMLHRGFILLPEGEFSNVTSFSPPLTITEKELASVVKALANILNRA